MRKKNLIQVLIHFGIIALIFQSCVSNAEQKGEIIWSDDKHGYFVDIRDGKKYKVVKFGTQIMMSENLAYKPSSGNYWAYDNKQSNVSKYGYLYDWEIAKKVAPIGWHLPTKEEWENFYENSHNHNQDETYYENLLEEEKAVFQQVIQGGNSGFNALLSGIRQPDGTFGYLGKGTFLWSATANSEGGAWSFGCGTFDSTAGMSSDNPSYGESVRLFKD
jgi:uncharacterized protein (TIGR02145 family)